MQINQLRMNYIGLEHDTALSWTIGVKSIPEDIIQGEKEKRKRKQHFLHLKCDA